MIHINLIATERHGAMAARRFDLGQQLTVVGSLIMLVTGLLLGWRFWALGQQEAQLAAAVDTVRREEMRLGDVLRQVTEFEAQRAQLQQRLTLIDEWRRRQSAPVHLIDQISRSLPEMTWLVSLRQSASDITIEGRATSLASLSDFVTNLEASRYFQRPVEIVESEALSGQPDAAGLVNFTIRGRFQMSGMEPLPGATPPAQRGGKQGG